MWRRVSLSFMSSHPVFCYHVHLRPERYLKNTSEHSLSLTPTNSNGLNYINILLTLTFAQF
jgi:hypothetical protein